MSGMRATGSTPSPGLLSPTPFGRVSALMLRPMVLMALRAAPPEGAHTSLPILERVLPSMPGSTTTISRVFLALALQPSLRIE